MKDILWSLKQSRKAKVVLLVILLLAVATVAGYVLFDGNNSSNASYVNINQLPRLEGAEDARAYRIIDGVDAPITVSDVFPAAVVVENLSASRPQAGLDKANVVYEMLAEGGITRFVALFASAETVEKIGPVRSARTPHLDIAAEYGALYAHAGGSPDALSKITQYDIYDLNQFFNSVYYWRDAERRKTKALEHTLYTSSELLARAFRDKETPLTGGYEGWKFADEMPLESRPVDPRSITIDFSTFQYKVDYDYDRETNAYIRKQAEDPHVMEDGQTITTKNVIVQYVPTRLADPQGRLAMDLVGEGNGIVFMNGTPAVATWKKDSASSRTRWYDAENKEITFVRGTTWVEIVPNDREIRYTEPSSPNNT